VGPLAGVVAHGGTAGAVVEALLAVVALFVAVWSRERASRMSSRATGADDEPRVEKDRRGGERGRERSDP
jgi:hypothetical protein